MFGHDEDLGTMLELQRLGALVPGVVWWAEHEGPPRLKAPVLRHAPTWMSVLSPGLTMVVQPTSFRVEEDALTPLASAAALMDSRRDAQALTATERQAALDQLRSLRDAIVDDAELPEDLRRALLDRLRWWRRHWRRGRPEGKMLWPRRWSGWPGCHDGRGGDAR